MVSADDLKAAEVCDTPVFLFEFALPGGPTEYWSTHNVTIGGQKYDARVLRHNAFQLRASMDSSRDGSAGLTVVLANADGVCSEVEQEYGWKGARVIIRFAFVDLARAIATSDTRVLFSGVGNPVQEITDSVCRVSFADRMTLQRTYVPQVRIQRRCPWAFPGTLPQRQEALTGGAKGFYSQHYACGYSADVPGGCGNLNNGAPFTSCDGTRASCQQRGMWNIDAANQATRRFGGLEFVPSTILVRGYGDRSYHASAVTDNLARYNDYVPLTYGTGWYSPPVVFARNDGNLTRMEVLLGLGQISGVLKVVVNDVEVPLGQPGKNMTSTGWFTVLNTGSRTGTFDPDFSDGQGSPIGDPYGNLAYMSVVVPNRISDGTNLPQITVLIQGLQLQQFDATGNALQSSFSNNPAWVLLDLLRRNGWALEELDLESFATAAAACAGPVQTSDAHGNSATVPAYSCNLLVTRRTSLADVIRGIRTAANLYFVSGAEGRLQLKMEGSLGAQQGAKSAGTNSTEALGDGWPKYEFSDGPISGILRKSDGSSSLRVYTRSLADTPNFVSVEFQDELNEYQQDSLSIFDADDAARCGQEINTALPAVGLSNFPQASRVMSLYLSKAVQGNLYIDFATSFRAISLNPGDLIAVTYARENWTRQPFRVLSIAPDLNYRTAVITAQIHDEGWYSGAALASGNGRRQAAFDTGIPRPLIGSIITASGDTEFGITEAETQREDGSRFCTLSVTFTPPGKPALSTAAIPLVSLSAATNAAGGTLPGDSIRYYAVSAIDSAGNEGALSFLVMAMIPAGTDTNTVTLKGISCSSTTAGLNVYRGSTGADLLRIASGVPPAPMFIDTGLAATTAPPPDMNYDHANFYWRYELSPEVGAETHSSNTVGNSSLQMTADQYSRYLVRITEGAGAGQERMVANNSTTTVTITGTWDTEPDASSKFTITEPGWRFGATGATGPVAIDVPPTIYSVVEICGRSANVRDQECSIDLSPVTRYQLGGGTADTGVPTKPTFGLDAAGDGTLTVAGIGFTRLANTSSVMAGTFTVYYWDELNNPTPQTLASDVTNQATTLTLAGPPVTARTVVQIDSELFTVDATDPVTGGWTVTRGAYSSDAVAHTAGTAAYPLSSKTSVLPFARNFFGTRASGDYSYTVLIPHCRASTAELFVTNAFGNSDVCRKSFTDRIDGGIRTLAGGQIAMQIQGIVAVQAAAVPPLIVDSERTIRDVYAVAGRAPRGGAVVLNVTVNGAVLCQLTLADGSTVSNDVGGFGLGPLAEGAEVNVDVISVPAGANAVSAADLSVMIRL